MFTPPSSDFTLRLAKREDLSALVQLERYCFSPWIAFGTNYWQCLLRTATIQIWQLFHQEQLVGYICLRSNRRWRRLSIVTLAVHWQYRRRGLASYLLSLALEEACRLQMKHLSLEVETENLAARQLYQQHGFEPHSLLPDYYGMERHGLMLRRPCC